MDLRKLKTLIELVESSGIAELEISEGEERVRITRSLPASAQPASIGVPLVAQATSQPAGSPTGAAVPAVVEPEGHVVKSPMVGTFYRCASPGAKPFVEKGDVVDAGQTVAIVEAMKLMNQVQADQPGKVSEILVEDGQWVEFEQVLIYLEPIEAE